MSGRGAEEHSENFGHHRYGNGGSPPNRGRAIQTLSPRYTPPPLNPTPSPPNRKSSLMTNRYQRCRCSPSLILSLPSVYPASISPAARALSLALTSEDTDQYRSYNYSCSTFQVRRTSTTSLLRRLQRGSDKSFKLFVFSFRHELLLFIQTNVFLSLLLYFARKGQQQSARTDRQRLKRKKKKTVERSSVRLPNCLFCFENNCFNPVQLMTGGRDEGGAQMEESGASQ